MDRPIVLPKIKHPLLITRKSVVRGRRRANFLGKEATKDLIIQEVFNNGKRQVNISETYLTNKKTKTMLDLLTEESSDLAKVVSQPRQSP